jgi:hypothetical protein
MKYPVNPQTGEYLDQQTAQALIRHNGPSARPQSPRNLQAQSGSRSILVTWDAPILTDGVVGYKVYLDTELSLFTTLYDPNVRQITVPASAGSSPPARNIFISAFTKNNESVKVQIQGKATTEAGAPAVATPPAGSAASGTTGKQLGVDGSTSDTPRNL